MNASLPTIWPAIPASPVIPCNGPPISAGPVTVLNNHLAVAGNRVIFPGENWDNWAVLGEVNGNSMGESGLSPAYQTLVQQHLNRVAAQNFRAIRVHGLDSFHGGNLFGVQGSGQTMKLDQWALDALAWFIWQARDLRGIRICLTCHFNRLITKADVATIQGNAASPQPEIAELATYGFDGVSPGGLFPWDCLFPSVTALHSQFEEQWFSYVSKYNGKTIGQQVDFLVCFNEQLLGKIIPWSFGPPVLEAARGQQFAGWCAANGVTNPGQREHAQFAASLDVARAQAACTRLRALCPQALLISGTYFGDGGYPSLPGCQVGDIVDFHSYPYYGGAGEQNGYLHGRSGQTPPDPCSRFAATGRGCYCAGKPQVCTEWSGVNQSNDQPSPIAEQAQEVQAVYNAAIAQDLDALFLYSDCSTEIQGDGSPYWKPSAYDQRINALYMGGIAFWNAQFADVKNRASLPTVSVSRTNGMWGAAPASGSGWQIYGPYTDPALYQIPAGTKVMVAP